MCPALSWHLWKQLKYIQPKGRDEDFSGASVGRGDQPYTSTIPGSYRDPLLRGPTSRKWCPNQGSCDPRCRVWRLCRSHTRHMGRDPVPGNPVSSVCFVPLEISNIWTEGVSLINLWSFSFCSPSRSHMRPGTLSGLLLCVLLSENLWWCYINIIAYHMLIHRVTAVWFPLDRAQVT